MKDAIKKLENETLDLANLQEYIDLKIKDNVEQMKILNQMLTYEKEISFLDSTVVPFRNMYVNADLLNNDIIKNKINNMMVNISELRYLLTGQ